MKKPSKCIIIIALLITTMFCVLIFVTNRYTYKKIKLEGEFQSACSSQYTNKIAILTDGELSLYDQYGKLQERYTKHKITFAYPLEETVWIIDDKSLLYEIKNEEYELVLTDICYFNTNSKSHTAITTSGELYVWGDNSNNILGIKNNGYIEEPTRIENLKNVKETIITPDHIYALTDEGKVYATGVVYSKYDSPDYEEILYEFTLLEELDHVEHIYDGYRDVYAQNDSIIAWSKLIKTQDGDNYTIFTLFDINDFFAKEIVQSFSKGENFTACLTSGGEIFYWGFDFLSVTCCDDYAMPPKKVPYIDDVDMIYSGRDVVYAKKGENIFIIKKRYTMNDFLNKLLN